ncbi:DUF1987 domain-containing protein [Paracrocinitomix mangrovi]|uniref:DUF1987 domain-containing protein n=1 Tax=Paracrocinitomix mangrovi TaxID=2862509 RepID=UPI001C8CFBDE|nr:DUF1987 domain-containing protein [Paracrocinitomix mangrovi]UKN02148.1 DUF1987 domain-containing protein [Paracrocinitomix mangrovi]
MENLVIKGSDKTPHFNMQPNGNISFGGVSMPEDAADFYFRIIDWISDYYRNPSTKTDITVSFKYLNSSSSSMIFKIFHCLNNLHITGKTRVKCYWYYEKSDEMMKNYIERVMTYAEDIDFKVYPTDNILDAQAS